MTDKMGRFRYWGDQKPDTSRPLLTVTRPAEAVAVKAQQGDAPTATAESGTLRIYGPIDSWGGFWGVSAKEVAQALDLLGDVKRVVVRVNSPGGESSEGRAIMNLLRAHPAECLAVVDGAAYSAASYIAVGCNETVMSPGTTLMIHDTSTIIYGNADELRKQAGILDTISNSGAELYAEVAGGTVEEWRERQKAETWYTAADAVTAGLADRVAVIPDLGPAETAGDEPEPVDNEGVEDRARATYDLSLFDQGRIPAPIKPPAESSDGSHNTEGGTAVAFSDEQITDMRKLLGVAEDADEAAFVAALTSVVDKVTEPPANTERAKVPEGMTLVESDALNALKSDAAAGRSARKQLDDQARDAAVDAAVRAGKITPARREYWTKSWEADPEGTKATLDGLEAGLVPVAEIGNAGEPDTKTADDELYELVFGAESKGA